MIEPTWQSPNDQVMKAPFPWFGGKRRIAPLVWSALGNNDANRENECLWFSPYCENVRNRQPLFQEPVPQQKELLP